MDSTITFEMLIKLAGIIAAAWAFYKIIMEIVKAITNRHDREQEWDKVSDLENIMIEKYKEDQKKKWREYDSKIEHTNEQIVKVNESIADLSIDTDAKLQEIKSELCILTESVNAILDGLKQLNCNGPVTEAKEKLDAYLIGQAHK